MMRDDFKKSDVNELARQSGFRCSNPSCGRVTVGPNGGDGSASIGVAAHVCAAATGGPRFDADMSREERSSIKNGIWLCQTCSRLIDADVQSHPVDTLYEWKKLSEIQAYLALRNLEVVRSRSFNELERKIPELMAEMRKDLNEHPFTREFIIMSKKWIYNGSGKMIFSYYFEDHEHLQGKMTMCENYGAIVEITFNNVDRYEFTEDFLDSSFKCNTHGPEGIGCCDGQTIQAPQQRGPWRDIGRTPARQPRS
ncbi:MAG: hypothetical protein ACI8R4_002517 [Paracoccaceae bacterium]|jgi:hypothetical protein